jgi:hypothetical protein
MSKVTRWGSLSVIWGVAALGLYEAGELSQRSHHESPAACEQIVLPDSCTTQDERNNGANKAIYIGMAVGLGALSLASVWKAGNAFQENREENRLYQGYATKY